MSHNLLIKPFNSPKSDRSFLDVRVCQYTCIVLGQSCDSLKGLKVEQIPKKSNKRLLQYVHSLMITHESPAAFLDASSKMYDEENV